MSDLAQAIPAVERPSARPARVSQETVVAWRLAWRVALGSRLIVWAAGLATIALFGINSAAMHHLDPNGVTSPFGSPLNQLLAPSSRWDSAWYLQIAHSGYVGPKSPNFFPLYPLLIGIGSQVIDQPLLIGLAISLAAMLAGLTLLYRLALLDLNEPAARLTVMLVALFPSSLFLSATYTESLFLLLSLSAVYAARRDRWALAGICGGLAAATRSNGVLLIVPLSILYLYGPRPAQTRPERAWWRPRYALHRSAAWLALVPAGLAAYLGYLWIARGQPLAPFISQQVYWQHTFAGPFGAVVIAVRQLPGDLHAVLTGTGQMLGPGAPLSEQAYDLLDFAFLGIAALGLVLSWQRLPFAYTAYALVMLAEVLSVPTPTEPIASIARYVLPLFPLFMGLAARLSERRESAVMALRLSGVMLAVFSGLWAIWAWVA